VTIIIIIIIEFFIIYNNHSINFNCLKNSKEAKYRQELEGKKDMPIKLKAYSKIK
jgi:hypothetical protein